MPNSNLPSSASRRHFLSGVSGAVVTTAIGAAAISATPESIAAPPAGAGQPGAQREAAATNLRKQANQLSVTIPQQAQVRNNDETLYSDLRANFFKYLPQNNNADVDLAAYAKLKTAIASGLSGDFAAITLAPGAVRKLVSPQAAYAFEMSGGDLQQSRIAPAPAFASATQAAEIAEVYWQAITRDVPFTDYSSNSLIADALADLNNFSAKVGPKVGNSITADTIFRGEAAGDLIGPYVSQFLLAPVPYGPTTIVQRHKVPVASVDFMTTQADFLAIQRGAAPVSPTVFDPTQRYIYNGRALGEWVHFDVSFQGFLNAALIMLSYGPAALSPTNPYVTSSNQAGFVTFGAADIVDLVCRAANIGLKTAWYQKWQVHRRLRPEVFASRVDSQRRGIFNYGVHADIINSGVVNRLISQNGNALLPMAFPEGAPAHPAYPSGHATISGACATILKALFNQNFVIPNPVQANVDGTALIPYSGPTLTIGNEIDKLASNVAIGRDTAGVHYRSDAIEGINAGEQVAAPLLQEYSMTYNEEFDGFKVTRYKGTQFHIKNGIYI
jgi:membrane-associated phospholipid phosphatase